MEYGIAFWSDADLPRAVAALNQGVEDCVRLAFEQYQWHYKRFQYRPGPDEPNPYWVDKSRD